MTTTQWQQEWQSAITDPAMLIKHLGLDPALLEPARAAAKLFPLRVPPAYLARIKKADLADPLLQQVLPLGIETLPSTGFTADPVGDNASLHNGGVIHKYTGRALLITTGACAINCRYCFRRHFPYAESNASTGQWQQALDYLRNNPSIHEVLLSGGDPLSLNDRRLSELANKLATLPQIRRLRIHTRLPIVIPSRITDELIGWLTNHPFKPIMVIHANHPNELDDHVAAAMQRLTKAGIPLYNQSVLLRGINDNADTLADLSERLFELNVQPYYLHLLDRVQGAAHFDLPEQEAHRLMQTLAAQLPGYLLPRLVREVAGAPWKVPVVWWEA